MTTSNNFRRGMVIDVDGILYQIVEFQHVKPGKGPAFVRSKLKAVLSGKVVSKTWRGGEKVTEVRVEYRIYQLLYSTDSEYVAMNPETYEQVHLNSDLVESASKYLLDNCDIKIAFIDETPILVEPPAFVNMKVIKTDPGLKGDTVSGGSKPATLESGLQVTVPLFITEGDIIRIDTRSDKYIERIST